MGGSARTACVVELYYLNQRHVTYNAYSLNSEYCDYIEDSIKSPYSLYRELPMKEERDIINLFLESLRDLPDVHVAYAESELQVLDAVYDARIDLHVGGKSVTLLVEVKKAVYPRDVRQVLWQFNELKQRPSSIAGSQTQALLAAESISPGAKELLRAQRVGYFDSGGSLFLPAPGAYLYIDKPPPKSVIRSMRSLFSGRRAQVLHAVLLRHREWFGVTEIAAESKVAPSTASEVLTQLDRLDWLESRGNGPGKERKIREPGALLDAWAKHQAVLRPLNARRYYVPGVKTDSLLSHLGRILNHHRVEYAVTSEAAAQRYAPFLSIVSFVRARILAGAAADGAVADLNARVVNEGSNLAIIETKSAGELLFREQLEGVWFATPVQVYLDLLRGEGRAKEMAEHLRKERIKF